MEFKEFCRQKDRMCANRANCRECLLNNDDKKTCAEFCVICPAEAEKLVQKWAEEHPEEPPIPTEDKPFIHQPSFEAGLKSGAEMKKGFESDKQSAYERGLQDTWDLAIKIACHILPEDLYKIFNTNEVDEIMNGFTPQEAMQKIKEWEDERNFKTGDIVEFKDGTKAVVMDIESDETVAVFTENECAESGIFKDAINKTGRNVADQLNALLEAVKGE